MLKWLHLTRALSWYIISSLLLWHEKLEVLSFVLHSTPFGMKTHESLMFCLLILSALLGADIPSTLYNFLLSLANRIILLVLLPCIYEQYYQKTVLELQF